MTFKQSFYRFICRCLGWQAEDLYPEVKRCIIVLAPHTSNWDFIMGKLTAGSVGRKGMFLIKSDWFFFPLNLFFKAIGGIPVYRNKRNAHMTDAVADLFSQREELCIAITPEGTRKANPHWKKGFYYIAQKAQVPILLCQLDYEKKYGGITELFYPSGDEEADLRHIKDYFKNVQGKHPENFVTD